MNDINYLVFRGGKPVCWVWKLPFFGFGFLPKLVGVGFLPDFFAVLSLFVRLTESPAAELFFLRADW